MGDWETAIPTRNGQAWVRRGSDDTAVFNPETEKLHLLNASALAIWELCDGSTTGVEMAEAVAELAYRGAQHLVVRRQSVDYRRLHRTRAGRRYDEDVVGGFEDLLDAVRRPIEDLLELRAAVVDHGLGHGPEYLFRHGDWTRNSQVHGASSSALRDVMTARF